MPQYSNSFPLQGGGTVNAVLNSESNTITYTVTAPGGQTATLTLPPDANPQSVQNINAIRAQFQSQGVSALSVAGFGQALQATQFNTQEEATKAQAAAASNNTTVAENPQPPPPVNNTPEGTDPPAETPINGLDLPPTPPADEFGNLDQAIERQQASEPVLSEDGEVATGIRRNTETGEVYYTDPPQGDDPPFDEFAGVDEAVAEQKRIAYNTQGQPVLAEDGSVAEGVAINPETGETYYPNGFPGPKGTSAAQTNTQTQATQQDQVNFAQFEDWRVRLSLAPGSNYLYNVKGAQGILAPLAATNGILFPYTPSISVQYSASYDATDLTHSNYKMYQYKNSHVDSISITCDFTAQDTFEANYLLAVIHFLRSVTKMFYGQDQEPKRGTPPPLCYLTGLGAFQFDAHPLALTNFTYSLPNDVDYIRAGTTTTSAGVNKSNERSPDNSGSARGDRDPGIAPGGVKPAPLFKNVPGGTIEPTYVPTKMQIQIQAVPIVSRNDISNNFSLKEYATGALLRGMKGNKRISGGMW